MSNNIRTPPKQYFFPKGEAVAAPRALQPMYRQDGLGEPPIDELYIPLDSNVESKIEDLRTELMGGSKQFSGSKSELQEIVDSGAFDPRPFTHGKDEIATNLDTDYGQRGTFAQFIGNMKAGSSQLHPPDDQIDEGKSEDWEKEAENLLEWSKGLPEAV
jgi:hypothetical protein